MSITGLLLGVDFLDEFAGVASLGTPEIQTDFGISYTAASLILFTVPMCSGVLLEPPIYMLADRMPRKGFVVGGVFAMGMLLLLCSLATGPWMLGAAYGGWAVASGVGVGLAQGALMDANPERREQLMTRWVFMGALGDLAAPMLVGMLSLLAMGWQESFLVVGIATLAYSVLLATKTFPDVSKSYDEEDEPPMAVALKTALSNKPLLFWLLGASLCALLDEILVAFGALYLGESLGATIAERGVVFFMMGIGGLIGLRGTETLLERGTSPKKLLGISSALCAAAYLAWLTAPSVEASAGLAVLVGVFIGPHYPIVQAQAYRALPGKSGMVNAVGVMFSPLEFGLPLLVGVVADQFGLLAALTVLLVQPLGLLVLCLRLK